MTFGQLNIDPKGIFRLIRAIT